MNFHNLFTSSVSACFELENTNCYYSGVKYKIILNGETQGETFESNVFSLFDLSPGTEYTVSTTLSDFSLTFKTQEETACLNVRDFGARGDGVHNDSSAIQTAINACPPGGRVYIPKGVYVTGAMVLDSDMVLDIQEGAVLLGSEDLRDYPIWPGEIECGPDGKVLQTASWEGEPFSCHQSFLTANYKKNIYVVGRGRIDANSPKIGWWINHKQRTTARPKMLFTNECENVVLHGITLKDSPSWNLNPFFSKDLGFYDMHIIAPADSPNTDGCDPESCDGVNIIGVRFSVGDDAIAIKAGKVYMGKKYKTPAKSHTIRNCLMEFAHGGVVLGSEMSGGIKDLDVRQCLFDHTDRGLRIKTCRGRGKDGIIDNILFENIKMENVLTPLVINMYYNRNGGDSDYIQSLSAQPVDDGTPYIGKFHFKDMECNDCEYAAGYFAGLPEQPIGGVIIENVSFRMKKDAGSGFPAMRENIEKHSKKGLYFNCVKDVKLINVSFEGVDGENIVTENVESFANEEAK